MSVQGLDRLNAKLRAMPREAKAELGRAVEESAQRVATLARGLAPVDDGDLRDSIRVEPGRHELARRVTASAESETGSYSFDYALKAELASPFFYPAYRALKRSIIARRCRTPPSMFWPGSNELRTPSIDAVFGMSCMSP